MDRKKVCLIEPSAAIETDVSNIETDMQLVSDDFCLCENRVREVRARARACVPHNHPTLYREVCYAAEGLVNIFIINLQYILSTQQYDIFT